MRFSENDLSAQCDTILCLDTESEELPSQRRIFDGIKRYSKARGWHLKILPRDKTLPERMPSMLRSPEIAGCIVFDFRSDGFFPPAVFGSLPVVYFDSSSLFRWRGRVSVVCDNVAVARAAFRELTAGLPESYAAVPSTSLRPWNAARISEFRRLCLAAGKPCRVFPGRRDEDPSCRKKRLDNWVLRLPLRCAIFACNDNCALEVVQALSDVRRSIPRDNTVIGVDGDDVSPIGDISHVSSVKIDRELAGYLAAKALGEIIDGLPPGGGSVMFGPLLVTRRESTRGFGRREANVAAAVEMIRREACEGLSAAALASRFPGSRNLFERRFREAMGHSVLDEILYVRLQHVLTLLSRPDIPISAIADFSGFSSDRELRQLFLRRFRCSMRQWRKVRMK